MIRVLFFAQLADYAQRDGSSVDYQAGLTPRAVVDALAADMPAELIEALRFDANMLSVNQVFAGWDDPLSDGDEVAFLPPFSGG